MHRDLDRDTRCSSEALTQFEGSFINHPGFPNYCHSSRVSLTVIEYVYDQFLNKSITGHMYLVKTEFTDLTEQVTFCITSSSIHCL